MPIREWPRDVAPTSERYLEIVEEVHARLSSICIEMSAPLFDQMVERIAFVQLTFERRLA
jgi:hypothetical protein